MIWLILGVLLWAGAHLFKRILPGVRGPMGDAGKGVVALALLASVVLMVIGYRAADSTYYWTRSPMLVGINNLLMLLAFYVFGSSMAKDQKVWIGTVIRNPQLTGFSIWAIAHLLVNGDTASFVLFGGLLIWAQAEILILNRAAGPWVRPERAPVRKEIVLVVVTLAVTIVVMMIHYWLGVTPWG
jgi:uncharacterized membrane protein